LEALGLRYLADPAHQLPILNAAVTSEGVEEAALRKKLLTQYGIEIGGGLGAGKGKLWHIGLMGESTTPRHVETVLEALKEIYREP
jgi:alanine-glyoxylate transaminase/serine-glyoxylate transaminase/serine-pyruvate transaminase